MDLGKKLRQAGPVAFREGSYSLSIRVLTNDTSHGDEMTRDDANNLLDLAKSGAPVPEPCLLVALHMTGDAPQQPFCDWADTVEFVHALKKSEILPSHA